MKKLVSNCSYTMNIQNPTLFIHCMCILHDDIDS